MRLSRIETRLDHDPLENREPPAKSPRYLDRTPAFDKTHYIRYSVLRLNTEHIWT